MCPWLCSATFILQPTAIEGPTTAGGADQGRMGWLTHGSLKGAVAVLAVLWAVFDSLILKRGCFCTVHAQRLLVR